MIGSEKVTALATRVPETLLMKSPSISGIMDCTTPQHEAGYGKEENRARNGSVQYEVAALGGGLVEKLEVHRWVMIARMKALPLGGDASLSPPGAKVAKDGASSMWITFVATR